MKEIAKISSQEFIKHFFSYHGATLQEEKGVLHIYLEIQQKEQQELIKLFGVAEFHFVFEVKSVADGLELLTPGHPLLDQIYKFLQKRGRKMVVVLPKKKKTISLLQAKKYIQPRNALPFHVTGQHLYQDEIVFQFKVLYFSEKMREEELFEEGIHSNFSPLSKKVFGTEKGEKWRKRWVPPPHFSDLYEKALSRVLERVRVRATHFEKQLWEEMKQTGIQLGEFYRYQMQEISSKENVEQKTAKLQKEQHQQLQHLAEKYRLSLDIFLVGYQVFQVPIKRFLFQYAKGTLVLEYDLFANTWETLRCHLCQKIPKKYDITEFGELLCKMCLKLCPFCEQEKKLESVCAVCQKEVCRDCFSTCVHCGQDICSRDLEKCFYCREKICKNCVFACMLCLKTRGCPAHFFEFEKQQVCLSCGFTCKHCHQIWPSGKERKCVQCGQLFCEQCLWSCRVCSSVFCGSHSQCNQCGA